MLVDIEVITKATNKSIENTATCLHLVIKQLVTPGDAPVDPSLGTKAARRDWEAAFSHKYILPILNVSRIKFKATKKL